jgi:hypothetical protein
MSTKDYEGIEEWILVVINFSGEGVHNFWLEGVLLAVQSVLTKTYPFKHEVL